MRPVTYLLERLQNIASAFYRCLLRVKINAHQQFAYWKSKIKRDDRRVQQDQELNSKTNVKLADISANNDGSIATTSTSASVELSSGHHRQASQAQPISCQKADLYSSPQLVGSKLIKTPRTRKLKLFSFLRRLSPRNFMDYCVIALNEASGSGSSNRFDLSSCESCIWLLGRKYDLPDESTDLIEDIRSKLWITYRRNFPPIDENTRYTTDRGFGCMIRCGQMVLANALLYKNLGRDWRWSPKGLESNPKVYTKILKLFQDREDCPYSIHRIVHTGGQHEGKSVGEWFGPNTIAQALKRMSTNYLGSGEIDNEIVISIDAALDNMVVIDEIKSRFKHASRTREATNVSNECGDSKTVEESTAGKPGCSEPSQTDKNAHWIPGILFIQLRLGLTKINPLYFSALKHTFQFQNSLGIIGGRPNHALYLVGYTDDDIIYLDPHSTQQYIDFDNLPEQDNNDEASAQQQQSSEQRASNHNDQEASSNSTTTSDSTYHCSSPEKMPLDRLDPSLALCFYFNTEEEFDSWCELAQELLVKSEQAPMFEITKSRPTDWNMSITSRTMSKSSSDHEEEFEILT